MQNLDIINKLLGDNLINADFSNIDCYVRPQLGVFIPIAVSSSNLEFLCPSYLILICFEPIENKQTHYYAEITSPNVAHINIDKQHCYCIAIEKEYFEKRYLMYAETLQIYNKKQFQMCSDVLKALNTFAFECSKSMINSNITLDAQAEIITHWIIRSIFGETLDLRAISNDYSIAKAQHYMEQHYMENITVEKLANLGYVSTSCFNRKFKKEIGITPIEYLIEIRIQKSKILLRRKSIAITDIAIRCGFSSSSHFSSCFQNKMGISPSDYRKKYME